MTTPTFAGAAVPRRVALVTLGCVRNEVDSEELAGRLGAAGWELVADAADADVAVVNTCGFVEQAKKDSIDALLEASDLKSTGRTQAVVAVGCLAERYGEQLAAQLPEADAVLGFDSYTELSGSLTAILDGARPASHTPTDRRRLLPLSPADRQPARSSVAARPAGAAHGRAPASGPRVVRQRLDGRPWAPLKIASGCDRRCSFCAIPMFRGAFVSRPPAEIVQEANWLAQRGVRELFLVSENSTSYGKDLGDLRLLETLLPELAEVDGVSRVRVSYLQPAEIRPGLLDAMASTEGVAPYFDISFQHASEPLLRRMRRFGSRPAFLELLDQVRRRAPLAGVRSNVIVGFPGETDADLAELEQFLVAARLDVVGVFGYSDEDGTEAESHAGKLPEHEVADRLDHVSRLVEELNVQRAEERVGELVHVLVESVASADGGSVADVPDGTAAVGRAAHQGPDVDGVTLLRASPVPRGRIGQPLAGRLRVGELVRARVVATEGIDLVAEPC